MAAARRELAPVALTDLARWIDQATKYVELDRLAISPQCGFASSYTTTRFTRADEERKLAHLVAAANAIWGSA